MKYLFMSALTIAASLALANKQQPTVLTGPLIEERVRECRSFRSKIEDYQKKYNVPAVMTSFAIKDPATQKEAIDLLASSPVLSPKMRDEISRLLSIPISQSNADPYLAAHVSVMANLNCSHMFESETISGLLNSAKLGTVGVKTSDVKNLWKAYLEKELTGLISVSRFQNIQSSTRYLEKEKLILLPVRYSEVCKEIEKFIISSRLPKTSPQPTAMELTALAQYSQSRLKQEMDLEIKMREAVQQLLRNN